MVSFQILSYEYNSSIRVKVALFFENYVCCMYFSGHRYLCIFFQKIPQNYIGIYPSDTWQNVTL